MSVEVAISPPSGAGALGIPVTSAGTVPAELGVERDAFSNEQLESEVADLQNMGAETPAEPGAITAARFLAEFVDGLPWAHIGD